MPSRLGQFAPQRLGGDHLAGLGGFAVVPAPALLVVAPREVGRFHKRPGQILVAAFLVVLRFTLAIAQPLGIDHAAVAGKVAIRLEPLYISNFHRDGHPQNPPNAGKGQQLVVERDFPGAGQHRFLQPADALGQRADVLGLHLGDQLVGRVLVQLGGFLGLQLLEVVQGERLAGGARVETLEAEQQGGALMHQVGPPPEQIAHGPQLRVINVGLGQNVEPLQVRQVKSVVLVVSVLQAAVWLDLRRVSQVNWVALGAQTIDQPIPIERRFNRH